MKNEQKKNEQKKNTSYKRFYLLIGVLIAYGVLFVIDSEKTGISTLYSLKIMKDILPILAIVYIFMALFNFIPEKHLKSYIQKTTGFYQYLIMSVLGMISHGPIYAWYPLLKDLGNRGLTEGSIAAYLFSKGIKLTLLPIMIHYFGFPLTAWFTLTLFLLSFLQGYLIDLFMKKTPQ
jgi:uncharacterized membrane protein YraQ (UPF0718 family)